MNVTVSIVRTVVRQKNEQKRRDKPPHRPRYAQRERCTAKAKQKSARHNRHTQVMPYASNNEAIIILCVRLTISFSSLSLSLLLNESTQRNCVQQNNCTWTCADPFTLGHNGNGRAAVQMTTQECCFATWDTIPLIRLTCIVSLFAVLFLCVDWRHSCFGIGHGEEVEEGGLWNDMRQIKFTSIERFVDLISFSSSFFSDCQKCWKMKMSILRSFDWRQPEVT